MRINRGEQSIAVLDKVKESCDIRKMDNEDIFMMAFEMGATFLASVFGCKFDDNGNMLDQNGELIKVEESGNEKA